jgi:hypothetical protein
MFVPAVIKPGGDALRYGRLNQEVTGDRGGKKTWIPAFIRHVEGQENTQIPPERVGTHASRPKWLRETVGYKDGAMN